MNRTNRDDATPVPSVFSIERVVGPDHIDGLDHANNTVYVKWMEECATAHSAKAGWTYEVYRKIGAAWVVRRHEIVYLRPASLGTRLRIETWVTNLKRVTSRRCYRFVDAETDQELVRATTDWAFVDRGSGRPIRIPEKLINDLPLETDRFNSV